MSAAELSPTSMEGRMVELARTLDATADLNLALDAVTFAALDLVPGTEFAGVTLRRPGKKLWSVATTAPQAEEADRLQYELDEGPCTDAAREELLVTTADAAADARWPRWGAAVATMIGSVMSVQLVSARGVHGALNLYSSTSHAFGPGSVYAAAALSVHAGVALRTVLLEEDLKKATASKLVIGQAQGILMHKFDLDADTAFGVLSRYSQQHNTKIIDLAQRLVADRGGSFPPS